MTFKTADDFHPEVLKLFDRYVHGLITRQGFLDGAAPYAADGVTAAGLLDALNPRFVDARQVSLDDRRIRTSRVEFPSPDGYGTVRGYLAQPAPPVGKLPVILVAHENRGLNPHIEDIARRLAVQGFIAFAPDALHPLGGYPGDEEKARELFMQLDRAKTRQDFVAAARALKSLPGGNGKVGVVGFCFGGGIANSLAATLPDLAAAVPFYGSPASPDEAHRIKAPLQIHFAAVDERINAGWPAYEAALNEAGASYEAFIYPGTQHGFNNDTTPRYDASAARLAWQRTVTFFNRHLRS